MLEEEGRYVHSEGDTNWWVSSGRVFSLTGNTNDDPASGTSVTPEITSFCRGAFAIRFIDEDFETESLVNYDAYDSIVAQTRDALDNLVTTRNDYRVLQPSLLTDPNGNRSEVAFDTLGMVVGTAVMGKALPAPVKDDIACRIQCRPGRGHGPRPLWTILSPTRMRSCSAPPRGWFTTCSPTIEPKTRRHLNRRLPMRWRERHTTLILPRPSKPRSSTSFRLLRRLRPRDPEKDPGGAGTSCRRWSRIASALGGYRAGRCSTTRANRCASSSRSSAPPIVSNRTCGSG